MSGLPDLEATIGKLEAATERAREATREANASTRAARQERKALDASRVELAAMVESMFVDRLDAIATERLDTFATVVREAIDSSSDRVIRVFDDLLAACMIGDGPDAYDLRAELPSFVKRQNVTPGPTLAAMAAKRDAAVRLGLAVAEVVKLGRSVGSSGAPELMSSALVELDAAIEAATS